MATERIDIVISERGSRVVRRNVEDIGDSGRRAAGGLDYLKRALAGLGLAFGAREIIQTIDAYTNLQNRLRSTGLEGKNLTGVYQALLKVANETRSSVEGSVELYSRLALSSKELGVSQQQLITFTKSLNQAIILSGASATEAQAGLIQLSQGMASGTLRGDELRSVLEQLPAVADVIAKKLGVTRGELRKMGEDGKITAKTIVDAFEASREELEERFGKTIPTIGQAFTTLKNNWVDLLGTFAETSGITAMVSKAIMLVAENLDTVVKSLIAVTAGFVIVGGSVKIWNAVTIAVRALNAAIAANPLGAFLIVLTSVITALVLFRDQIKLGTDDTTTLGDLMRAAWEGIGPMIQAVADAAAQFFSWFGSTAAGTFNEFINNLAGVEHSNESTWLKILRIVVRTFDMIGAAIRGTFMAAGRSIGIFAAGVVQTFLNMGSVIQNVLAGNFGAAWDAAKNVLDQGKQTWKDIGATWGESYSEAFSEQVSGGLENALDNLIDRAKEIGAARKAAEEANGGAVSGVAPPAVALPGSGDKGKERKKLLDELQQLIGQYDRVYAAQMELKKATELLDKAQAAGLITAERKAEVLALINEQLRDQLDPLGAVNRELDKELKLLTMTTDAREVEAQVMSITQELRMAGVQIGEKELEQLREKLKLIQEQTKLDAAVNAMRGSTKGGRDEEFNLQAEALKRLQGSGDATEADSFNILNQMLGGSLDNTQSAFEARLAQFDEFYLRVQQLREKDVINAQQAAEAMNAIDRARAELQLEQVQSTLGVISGLMASHNKTAFKIGQAAAIADATITGIKMAMNAYESASKIPYVGWILGPTAAAAAAVVAATNISKIRSQQPPQYRTGGEYVVGGHGGVDSQHVAFRATPGERISINTPSQAHAMQNIERMLRSEDGGGRRGNFTQNLTIVQQGRPNRRTSEQEAKKVRKATQAEYERNN